MKKLISGLLIILIISVLFISSCEYIIQLPKPVEIGDTAKKNMLNTIQDIEKASLEPNSLNVLFPEGPEANAAKEVAGEFEKLHGVKINIFESEWKDAKEIIKSSATGGQKSILDVVVFPEYYIGAISANVTDLDEYILKDNFDTEDYIPDIFENTAKWEGAIKCIPIQSSVVCVVYRKDIFLENNINIEKGWDYKEYNNSIERLTSKGLYGILFDPSKSSLSYYWSDRYWSLGGKTATEDWKVTVDNEINLESIRLLKDLMNFTSKDLLEMSYSDVISDFIAGKSAAIETFPDFLFNKNLLNSSVYGSIGILPEPTGPAGDCVQINSKVTGILNKSNKKQMAWEWIKFFTSQDKQIFYLKEFGILSPRISTYKNLDLNKEFILLKDIYDIFINSKIKTRWKIPASYEAWEITLNNILLDILKNNKTPEQGIKELQEKWEGVLEVKPPDPGILNKE